MFKPLSAAIVALSLVAVAQPASAQISLARPLPTPSPIAAPVTGFSLTIAAVTLRTATAPASVTGRAGVVWSFNGSGTVAGAGATLNGTPVAPAALKVGMTCLIDGTKTGDLTGLITKIACKG